jgi:1,3-beta-glucan synthase
MAARPGPRGQEPYLTTPTDPFGSSNNIPRKYYDNESDNQDYGRNRDTYTSESSHGPQDGERYYDHNGTYDPYSMFNT